MDLIWPDREQGVKLPVRFSPEDLRKYPIFLGFFGGILGRDFFLDILPPLLHIRLILK
jgi:hypothetical protein